MSEKYHSSKLAVRSDSVPPLSAIGSDTVNSSRRKPTNWTVNRYRKIDPQFWKDEKITQFDPQDKLITLYLFTGQSNRIGIFSFSPGEAGEDLGMLPQTFAERFRNVCLALNLGWDERFRVLYLPTWWKYNPPENSNNVIGNLKDLDDVPESHLIDLFAENVQHLAENLRETFTQTLAKRYPERYPKRSPSQEQEQEQEYKNGAEAPVSISSTSKKRRTARAARIVPPELQPAVFKIIGRINELAGTNYRPDSKIVVEGLVPRLSGGATEADCIAVVEDRHRAWRDKPEMQEYFNPETLFREGKFEKYKNAALMNGNQVRKEHKFVNA